VTDYIRPLQRLTRSDEPRFGGKSANLGELHHESRRLCLEGALRFIARSEMANSHVNRVTNRLVGI